MTIIDFPSVLPEAHSSSQRAGYTDLIFHQRRKFPFTAACYTYAVEFSQLHSDQHVQLITHFHLAPWLRMRGTTPPAREHKR